MTDLEKKLKELETELKAKYEKECAELKAKYDKELQRIVNQANKFKDGLKFNWKHILGALVVGAGIAVVIGAKVLGLI